MIQDPVVEGLEPDAYVLSIHIALLFCARPEWPCRKLPNSVAPRRPVPCQRPFGAQGPKAPKANSDDAASRKTIKAHANFRGARPNITPQKQALCQVRLADRVYPARRDTADPTERGDI